MYKTCISEEEKTRTLLRNYVCNTLYNELHLGLSLRLDARLLRLLRSLLSRFLFSLGLISYVHI